MKFEFVIMGVIASCMLVTAGYLLGQNNSDQFNPEATYAQKPVETSHSHVHNLPHSHQEHVHSPYELKENEPMPEISLKIEEDVKGGWNLEVITKNFEFSGKHASQAHVSNQGHAHLMIDNKKITRLYGPWFYIPELAKGERVIQVNLNTNDHKVYSKNGKVIEASSRLLVK